MRISSIDTLKGIAIFMVVLIHTKPFLAIPEVKQHWYYTGNIIQQLSSFAVPFFYVAAGYFFSKGLEKGRIFDRWRNYCAKLLLLLLLWTLVDGIFGDYWLENVIKAKSIAPLLSNLREIPNFATNRPTLFFLRGT